MKNERLGRGLFAAIVFGVVLSLSINAFGQGKGRGGGVGGGRGSGSSGNSGGPPPGTGVDRGLGNASDRSNGRSNDGLANASTRSSGRSDAGLARARAASNLRQADRDLREHPGIAHSLHVNANDLRAGYQTALQTNPNLTFGHYVAATRLAHNLGTRFPNVTRDAILVQLAEGDSLGRALQDLGLSSQEAKAARKRAEREIKEAKN